jgi:hypothetical protein
MNRRKLYIALSGVLLVTILALALAFGVYGGQPDATGEEAALASGGGTQEGIHVSGHWTIDVREPDGTLASHHEFDNALASASYLPRLLNREHTVGGWYIFLMRAFGTSPWSYGSGRIAESPTILYCPSSVPYVSCNLSVSCPDSGDNADKLVLTGNIVAEQDGSIDRVSTGYCYCTSSVSPDNCPGAETTCENLTTANITQIDVLAGQQIAVTVVIGFS